MSILRRSALYTQKKGGQVRFLNWALTITKMGTMAEPFILNDRISPTTQIGDYDPSDPMSRVDELVGVDPNKSEWAATMGDTIPIHGGNILPRVFSKTGNF